MVSLVNSPAALAAWCSASVPRTRLTPRSIAPYGSPKEVDSSAVSPARSVRPKLSSSDIPGRTLGIPMSASEIDNSMK